MFGRSDNQNRGFSLDEWMPNDHTPGEKPNTGKIAWRGRLKAVQPRIRLLRSFDERHHSYPGYVLRIDGTCGDETGEFLIAVGKAAHGKHRFCAGMEVSGLSVPVPDPRQIGRAHV